MVELIPNFDPIGLPLPPSFLLALKVFGFVLHIIFMHLWLAGLPAAVVLLYWRRKAAQRLFTAMPFFMAFGINAGIVPLLLIQTLYPQFFYPATILQAWFWFLVIPLLLLAYYGVYLAAFGRFQVIAGVVASLLLSWIGLSFSAAMSLLATPEKWPAIFLATSHAGSVQGMFLDLSPEAILRFLLMAGMACGTVATFLVLDAEWFKKDADYRAEIRSLAPLLYAVGLIIFGAAGSAYAPTVLGKLPPVWSSLAGASMPLGASLAAAYWRWPRKGIVLALGFVHLIVLLSNAIARQMVQLHDLQKWVDLEKIPVRGEWGSFFLFVSVLVVALAIVSWIARIALRRARTVS